MSDNLITPDSRLRRASIVLQAEAADPALVWVGAAIASTSASTVSADFPLGQPGAVLAMRSASGRYWFARGSVGTSAGASSPSPVLFAWLRTAECAADDAPSSGWAAKPPASL